MEICIIGLGRMGSNMAKRLLKNKHKVFVYNRTYGKSLDLKKFGAHPIKNLSDISKTMKTPRIVWLMLPAGKTTDDHINIIKTLLNKNDLIIDGGNTYYKDDIRRAKDLSKLGIRYIDAGVSGGIWGLKNGYCMMLGGTPRDYKYINPILKTLAPKDGCILCGPVGSGHFVKMIHNGIEYALMESYAEGFEILKASMFGKDLNLDKIANVWNNGSVVRSWLLELLASALKKDPQLASIKGYVEDSGEGRWTVKEAVDTGVSATVIAHSLFKRFDSRQKNAFSNKILAALRHEFGGHEIKEKK